MRELWRNIGFTSGARLYSVVAGAASLVVTARALGPEGRGTVAAALTWTALFSTIGYLSLGQVANHRAIGKASEEWLPRVLPALAFMTGAVSVVGWIVAALCYLISDGHAFGEMPVYALILGFAMLPFLIWEQYGSWMLVAAGKLSFYNRREVAGRTLGVVLIVLLVGVAGAGIAGALIAMLIAQAVVAAAGFGYLRRQVAGRISFDRGFLRGIVADGIKLHLNAVGTFLYLEGAILVVQSLRGPSETGPFQVAVQLLTVGFLIPQATSMVLFGEVAKRGPNGAWPFNRRVLFALSGLMAVLAAIGFVLAPTLIPLIFGHGFRSAVPVFQILVFGIVGQTFSAVMASQWIGRGLFWQSSLLTLALGVVHLVAAILLVNAYGMKGAAWSLLGVYTVSVFGNGLMALWVEHRVRRDEAGLALSADAATSAAASHQSAS